MYEFLSTLATLFAQSGLQGLIIFVLFLGIFGLGYWILYKQLGEQQAQTAELKTLNQNFTVTSTKIDEIKEEISEIKTKQDLHGISLVKIDVRTEKCLKGGV